MDGKCLIHLEYEGSVERSMADVVVFDTSGNPLAEETVEDSFSLSRPAILVVRPTNFGYWGMVHQAQEGQSTVHIPKIASPGNFAWWHRLHGISPYGNGGKGIRVGIIDEALSRQGNESCIRHVSNLGGAAWSDPQAERAFRPAVLHSLAVCSLLASRPRDEISVSGIVPEADIIFAAAGDDDTEYLNPTRLANSIDLLVEEHHCHLIVISAGDSSEPTEEIRGSVLRARRRGCLCLFAAGNEGGAPMYPARYPECLAVGACGKLGTSPTDSVIEYADRTASVFGDNGLYLWAHSAHGPEVDLIAAGVGTLWSLDGRIAFAACGTSFAAPVATGVLANLLAEDSAYLDLGPSLQRTEHAIQRLMEHSHRMGFGPDIAALGLPVAG